MLAVLSAHQRMKNVTNIDRCKVCCICARGKHASFATLTLFFDGFEVFRIVALSNELMGLVQDVLYIQDVYTAVSYILVL